MKEIWDNIYEQKNVKEILNGIYDSRRVPHAFLFYGTDGVGKFNTALHFAKLLYTNRNYPDQDYAIKKISKLQEPYVKLVLPLPRGKGESSEDSSTDKLTKDQIELLHCEINNKVENPYYKITIENANTIKINSIRDIKRFLDISYNDIPLRFLFIVEADLMNDQAQNALLKSLEEPPEGIVFFLLTSNREKLLQTIQSRCWSVNFEPLSNESIKNILISDFGVEETIANQAAFFSNGSVTNALNLANKEFQTLLEGTISFLRFAIGKKYHSAYKELTSLLQHQSEEEYKQVIELIKNWLNDVLRIRLSYNKFYFENYKDTFTKFNQRYSKCSIQEILTSLDLLEEYYNKNLNLNVLILNIIFELASLSSRNYNCTI